MQIIENPQTIHDREISTRNARFETGRARELSRNKKMRTSPVGLFKKGESGIRPVKQTEKKHRSVLCQWLVSGERASWDHLVTSGRGDRRGK